MLTLHETAQSAIDAGISVLPIKPDGSKAPATGSWKRYQSERMSYGELLPHLDQHCGVAFIGGMVSGNLECLDFDDAEVYVAFTELCRVAGLGDLLERAHGYSESTPAGGVHLWYRCSEVDGNLKLASRTDPDDPKKRLTLIETRGEGGYAIVAPSPGNVHESGVGAWAALHGDVSTIPEISSEDRQELHRIARSLDELPIDSNTETIGGCASFASGASGASGGKYQRKTESDEEKPGAAYRRTKGNPDGWRELLKRNGWKLVYSKGDTGYWRRAGKERGISATTGFDGTDLLYVFSTSTVFESGRGYNIFAAYTVLEHDGDFKAATKALAAQGFGSKKKDTADDPPPNADESSEPDETDDIERKGRKSQATVLVEMAEASGIDLFHDLGDQPYAAIVVDDHQEIWPVRSAGFRRWLSALYFREHRTAASSNGVQDALSTLEGIALFEGESRAVSVRTAQGDDGAVYIDLGDADWRAIKVTASGWDVVTDVPVMFQRSKTTRPLPYPERGGKLADLCEFVNTRGGATGEDFLLISAYACAALLPTGPYPILDFSGEQGSAKTTAARVIRRLTDPRQVEVTNLASDDGDLATLAGNTQLLVFDNISSISDDTADKLCRLSTGGGFHKRMLYTDGEEFAVDAMRPVVLTGIPDLSTRPDLADRTIALELPSLRGRVAYRTDTEFWSEFDQAAPKMFGALLDALVLVLRNRETIHRTDWPRMADFARLGEAMLPAFGREPGEFVTAMRTNSGRQNEIIVEAYPVANELLRWAKDWSDPERTFTASTLLALLNDRVPEQVRKGRDWPKTARALSIDLRRTAPNLAAMRLAVTFERSENERRIRFVRDDRQASHESDQSMNGRAKAGAWQ